VALPPGSWRQRLLAPGNVNSKLATARRVLEAAAKTVAPPATENTNPVAPPTWVELFRRLTGIDVTRCARCGGAISSRALDRPMPKDTS
jgi:hypothetical protein